MAVAAALRAPVAAPAPPVAAPAALPAPSRAPGLSTLGPGQPLHTSVRLPVEQSFGTNLSAVRVHEGPAAAALAGQYQARAFATGSAIVLGAGERASDLGLMAHESAHVVQQSRGFPTVQRAPLQGGGAGHLESEASAASAAVLVGRPFTVTGRAPSGSIQRTSWWDRATSAVSGAVRSVAGAVRSAASAVAEAAGDFLGRILNYLRERVTSIPGYDVLGFVLGRDPVTQQPIERNARNLLRAITGLIPGGREMFTNLERSGVLERAFGWVNEELTRLQLTWAVIRGAIQEFIGRLGVGDLLNLSGVFDRARAIFGPILQRLLAFATAAGSKILEFIFEGALALAGGAAQRVLAIFRRIGATFRLVVNDPVGFLRNLLAAVMGGFRQFGTNILTHLRTAIFDWLFGALAGAGLRLPARFDLAGIISLVLQVLGLTWDALRLRLVRIVGEPAVRTLETAFDFIRTIVTQGLAAAWERIIEFATGLVDTVIDGIKAWVARTIVGQAIARIVTMFNPVGAIINAIMTIYNTVMFLVERAQQIMAFVDSVLDSITNIATGNITAAVGYVERTLARILPLVISFLARLIGLGGISDRIRDIIARIRAPIERAMDRVADWIQRTGRRFLSRALGGDPNATPQQRLQAAMTDAGAAVRRLSGSAIGLAVLRPVLALVRTRHNLTSLEAVPRNGEWILVGRVNPTQEFPSGKRVDTGTAGAGNPIPSRITYQAADSRRGGKRMVADPVGPDMLGQGSEPSDSGNSTIWPIVNIQRNGTRLYVRGHLLNHHIGGPGNDPRNLTPITYRANGDHQRTVESHIKTHIRGGGYAKYTVIVNYPGTPLAVPSGVNPAEGELATTLTTRWTLKNLGPSGTLVNVGSEQEHTVNNIGPTASPHWPQT